MSPFEADRHRLSPPLQHGLEGRPYHKSPQTKTCDRTLMPPGAPRPMKIEFTRQPLGGASSPDESSNNLNNINDLKFYHEIRGNLSFFAFQEGICEAQISALGGSPTVPHEPELSTAHENRRAIFRRVSGGFSRQKQDKRPQG